MGGLHQARLLDLSHCSLSDLAKPTFEGLMHLGTGRFVVNHVFYSSLVLSSTSVGSLQDLPTCSFFSDLAGHGESLKHLHRSFTRGQARIPFDTVAVHK